MNVTVTLLFLVLQSNRVTFNLTPEIIHQASLLVSNFLSETGIIILLAWAVKQWRRAKEI